MSASRIGIGVILAAIISISAFAWQGHERGSHLSRLREVVGNSEFEAVSHPDVMTAQRISHVRVGPESDLHQEYEPQSDAFRVDVELQNRLSQLLSSAASFEWSDVNKSCIPDFGVKLRFARDDGHVDLWICLSCAVLLIERPDGSLHSLNFDPIEKEMIDITKQLFPNDSGIAEF